jgi:pilus assembly protein CpaC
MRPASAAGAGGAPSTRVINLLQVRHAPQVLLDVRIAEVSKSLLDKLGVGVQASGGSNPRWNILSNFLGGGGGTAALLWGAGRAIHLEAEQKDGLVRILAEPSIVALSGKEGSFLVGGKVFIPVAQSGSGNSSAITLEEREYGVGLKFVPTVLGQGRIALKVASEVSELAKDSLSVDSRFGAGVLPALTSRRVATSVQLSDGQSLVIGRLMRNNLSASTNAFPFLGQIPVLGALFRSKQYASDLTELVVVVRASLVAPGPGAPALPTDRTPPPPRAGFLLQTSPEASVAPAAPAVLEAP